LQSRLKKQEYERSRIVPSKVVSLPIKKLSKKVEWVLLSFPPAPIPNLPMDKEPSQTGHQVFYIVVVGAIVDTDCASVSIGESTPFRKP